MKRLLVSFAYALVAAVVLVSRLPIVQSVFADTIAIDTSAYIQSQGGSPSSDSYTIGAVTNPILFVSYKLDASATVTSVAWNTTETLTQLCAVYDGSNVRRYLFMRQAPTTGAHNITTTYTGSPNWYAYVASYAGAAQTGQPDSSTAGGDAQATNPTTVATTVVAANSWLIMDSRDDSSNDLTITAGGHDVRADNSYWKLFDSNGAVAGGSRSMTVGHLGAVTLRSCLASFSPAAAAASSARRSLLLGVGN